MPGLDRVKAKLRSHAKAAIEAGVVEARKQAEIIAGLARAFAPAEELDLVKSIRVEGASTVVTRRGGEQGFVGVVVKAGSEATIITNKQGQRFQNAKLQETGTQDMPANPYFNPAKRMRRKQAKSAIGRAVNKAWKAGS
ncbi:hypothetical protein [Rhodobacter sp. 24-YEA-8]|uniref:hypothetical protein n=1 Tax=Rhodobacter sp. 24-YEA-8 TaxID=1884310 RepID=UPI00089C9947|nr:hypothetical protein [Rhodobacter sp. 24-YEA-8]SEB79340.1 phage protein, HK97 gp10 family [Rhodobacter sp. 24-YEA-8]